VTEELAQLLERSALEVAPALLGAMLRGRGVVVQLTEVEAYMGDVDPGSHAFRGETARNRVMFGPPGHLYAYFTYGMHTCANVVCGPSGTASAVLLRAGRVIEGADVARARRTTSRSDADLARGPARLTVALGLALGDNGTNLLDPSSPITLSLLDRRTEPAANAGHDRPPRRNALDHPEPGVAAGRVRCGPRTGVSGEGGSAEHFPWRFWIDADPTVSPYRAGTFRTSSSTSQAATRGGRDELLRVRQPL
jgi:DNA-3-methyladenine glycosylase